MVKRWSGRKPMSTPRRFHKVSIINAAPTSSANAIANCATTKVSRSLSPPRDSPARAPSFSDSCSETSVARRAGISPKNTPDKMETAAVNSSTGAFRANPFPAICSGTKFWNTLQQSRPTSSPARPPPTESKRLSVSNCAPICPRLAPSAIRTAISRRRPAARAKSRFARFEQAMSSTSTAAICNTHKPVAVSPANCSCRGTTTAPIFVLESGYFRCKRFAITSMSVLRPDNRHARLHARDDFQVVSRAARQIFRSERGWNPVLGLTIGKKESARHHADDRGGLAIHQNGTADDGRVSAKTPLPQRVTKDHDFAPGSVFFSRERPPNSGLYAEDIEKVRCDTAPQHLLWRLTPGKRCIGIPNRHHIREDFDFAPANPRNWRRQACYARSRDTMHPPRPSPAGSDRHRAGDAATLPLPR